MGQGQMLYGGSSKKWKVNNIFSVSLAISYIQIKIDIIFYHF